MITFAGVGAQVFQLPFGFRRPVDDRPDFIPDRKTQAGSG